MLRSATALAALALIGSTVGAGTAEARRCAYMTKTAGAVVGGVGGAVLGGILTHGAAGPLIGAAAGGVAGHEIARKNHYKCRYSRTYRRR
jgi:uncharacterized protein YcfJ